MNKLEFYKQCEFCYSSSWCTLHGDKWHCGCLFRGDEEE